MKWKEMLGKKEN
jgi:hypothetical protein